ncbi:MAG: ABC transporter permease [Bacteroidetes bacterium]|nr:ABC transporter permease [Bacteroidota bacterium]MCB9043413.1 ABC transporter permease [Chitinophagales bacterium]
MAGLVGLCVAFFLAVFAYLIIPDNSTHANRQILPIANQAPGFSAYLKIDTLGKKKSENFFRFLLNGHTLTQNYRAYYLLRSDTCPNLLVAYDAQNAADSLCANNFDKVLPYKQTFYLGTDPYGRDILSRLVLGIRVSLRVGLVAVLVSLLIGVALGSLAGYFGGWLDAFIMWWLNVFWSMPLLLWVFALIMALGKREIFIFVAIGLVMWVEVARIVRGEFLYYKQATFVEAAKAFGFSDFRIIFKHILPNLVGPLTVIAAANFANAILLEAGLSFLGIGIQPPTPSWGNLLAEYYPYLGGKLSYLALVPAFAILLLTLAFNFLGSGLRDVFDVRNG